jgi:hypothetical protein
VFGLGDGVATLTVLGFITTRYAHLTMFYTPLVSGGDSAGNAGDFSATIVQLSVKLVKLQAIRWRTGAGQPVQLPR